MLSSTLCIHTTLYYMYMYIKRRYYTPQCTICTWASRADTTLHNVLYVHVH